MRILVNDIAKSISLGICLLFCACFSFAESCSTVGAAQEYHTANPGCGYTTKTRTCCPDMNWSEWNEACDVKCEQINGKGNPVWYNGICCRNIPPYAEDGDDPRCWGEDGWIDKGRAFKVTSEGTGYFTAGVCNDVSLKEYRKNDWCYNRHKGTEFENAHPGTNCTGYSDLTCMIEATCGNKVSDEGNGMYKFEVKYKMMSCEKDGSPKLVYLPNQDK